MPANVENSAVATGLEKVSFHSNPKERQNAKECSNYHTIALISQASKVRLKILPARLRQHVNRQLPDVQAGIRKGREPEIKLPTRSPKREFEKNIYFCFIDYAKASDCGSQQTVENSSRDGNTRPPDLPLEKSGCRSSNS